MYQYKHTVTGTIIHTGNPICGGKWELVKAPTTTNATKKGPVATENVEIIDEPKTVKKTTKKKG